MKIGDRKVENCGKTFVIAEIGVNHDGSVLRALELVEAAAKCGADAVKVQVFQATSLMNARSSSFAKYQEQRCDDADPAAMLKRYELSAADLRRVFDATLQAGMVPIATPFSLSDVDVLQTLDVAAVKIASPDLVNRPLLERASQLGKPLLVSTGAATMEEVETTVQWMDEFGAPFVLMHCVSSYPTPAEQANLCWIGELRDSFGAIVGYSDHTTDVRSGSFAVSAGASVIERHLTYDRAASGPDHAASSDPEEFFEYVRLLRAAELLRGRPGKRVLGIEQDVRTVSRQSLVIRRDLRAGEPISQDDLIVQRPGTGIPAAHFAQALGRVAKKQIRAGDLLQWDMLSDAA